MEKILQDNGKEKFPQLSIFLNDGGKAANVDDLPRAIHQLTDLPRPARAQKQRNTRLLFVKPSGRTRNCSVEESDCVGITVCVFLFVKGVRLCWIVGMIKYIKRNNIA